MSSNGPDRQRDRETLLWIARLRCLSARELRMLVFRTGSRTRISRTLQRLERDGWITTWDEPAIGGARRYAVPTRRAIRWARLALQSQARGTDVERLARLQIDRGYPRRIRLEPGTLPPNFAHTREVNLLACAIERAYTPELRWLSTWDHPLPPEFGGLQLPQPDLIAVVGDPPSLVFLEHDRGTESLPRLEEKLRRYAELSFASSVCETLFGFEHLYLMITVMDARTRAPDRRLTKLREIVEEIPVPRTALALAGEIFDDQHLLTLRDLLR